MRRIDIIKRAGRNLRQSKGRTILTSLAISVGAFTIGLALMAGEGGRLYTNSIVDAAGDKKVMKLKRKINCQNTAIQNKMLEKIRNQPYEANMYSMTRT